MATTSVFNLTRFTALAAGDVLPVVDISDTTQSAHGSLDAITVTNFFGAIPVPVVVTSASATALAVGLNGATNSAFAVDASTASQVAGLKVTGAATGGTVALVVTDAGSNANLTLNAKGTGTIGIGSISTGRVTITPVVTITGTLTANGGISTSGISSSGTIATTGLAAINSSGTISAVLGISSTAGAITSGGNADLIAGAGGTLRIPSFAAPSTAASTGTLGQFAWQSGFLYVCVNTNTWQRVAIATW